MPYVVQWHDAEQTILRVDITGKVTWSEWHLTINQLAERLAQAPGRVDIILCSKTGFPSGNPLPHFKTTMTKLGQFSNLGMMVTVSSSQLAALVKSMLAIAARAHGAPLNRKEQFVSSMEEAMRMIEKDRAGEPLP